MDEYCEIIYADTYEVGHTYTAQVQLFTEHYTQDKKINIPISAICGNCEFYTKPEDEQKGLKVDIKNVGNSNWVGLKKILNHQLF